MTPDIVNDLYPTADEAVTNQLRNLARALVEHGFAPDIRTAVLLIATSLTHVADGEEGTTP